MEKFSFDITPANVKVRFANDKIVVVLKEENDHITIHFRNNFKLLDIHRKDQETGEYHHLYVARIEKIISALENLQNDFYELIQKFIHPTSYAELKAQNFWLQHNPYIEDFFDQKKIEWSEFENEVIGRSIQRPIEQMKDSIKENIEKRYQVFEEGSKEPVGELFQKATNFGHPIYFFISYQDVNKILKIGQEELIPHFSKLHDPEEQRKLEERYE